MCGVCGLASDPLKDEFDKIDANDDGYISLKEYNDYYTFEKEGFETVTSEEWHEMCEYVQAKPKQGINFYDFRVIRKMEDKKTERLEQIRLDLHNAELADPESVRILLDDFHKIDTNGDGYISLKELNAASKSTGVDELTSEQWHNSCKFLKAKRNQGYNFEDFRIFHKMGVEADN